MTKFTEGIGGKLAESWVAALLLPPSFFCAAGVSAYLFRHGWVRFAGQFDRFTRLPQVTQVAVVIGGLLLLMLSGGIAQQLTWPLLRLLEGYWPRPLSSVVLWMTRRQERRMRTQKQRWQELSRRYPSLDAAEYAEIAALDRWIVHTPANPNHLMPTRLGNLIRASELHPRLKYGLDVVACWPRLWLLLPADARNDLIAARDDLNANARYLLWSALVVVWTPWTLWAAAASAIATVFVYRGMLRSAETYGDLVEATFDTYRIELYKALRWPPPLNPAQEASIGREITSYLWRGSDERMPTFVESSKSLTNTKR